MGRALARRFARLWLRAHEAGSGERVPSRIGAFMLRADQRETTRRVLDAIEMLGGALLADPPGSGKTVVALAVAHALRGAEHGARAALVVAPAALRDQWRETSARAAVSIRFTSIESLGRGARATRASLVIVDEAHHARNPATRRHARLASLCAGSRVLLLSATPVVNRAADRAALLSLFVDPRRLERDPGLAERCVVRRREGPAGAPRTRRVAALTGRSAVAGLAEAIARLPPPLPADDGLAATTLVRLTLAHAWTSSLAALDAALRRREQRAGALEDSLRAGRWPTRDALRAWVVDGASTQLAFAELLDGPTPRATGAAELAEATRVLDTHVRAVRAIRRLIRPRIGPDTAARADAIVALASAHPDRRAVVFAQHATTIDALWSVLKRTPGVVTLTGSATRAAAGRWSRREVLRAVGPGATRHDPRDPRAIRLLLATDLLAEGIELPGIGIVVHADRPWTPARIEQREGRAARAGAIDDDVLVAGFASPVEADRLLALTARLRRKRRAGARALAPAERSARIAARLREWTRSENGPRTSQAVDGRTRGSGFALALVRAGPTMRVVAITRAGGRLRATSSSRVIDALLGAIDPRHARAADAHELHRIRIVLARWDRARRRLALLAPAGGLDPSLAVRLSGRVAAIVRSAPFPARASLASTLDKAVDALSQGTGVGIGHALRRALSRRYAAVDPVRRILAIARHAARRPTRSEGDGSRARLVALVLFDRSASAG